MDELRRRVAKRLTELRTERQWSQEELGARAGLTYKFIGEIERGQKNPSLDSLGRLAKGFGLDITELLGPGSPREPYPKLGPDPLAMMREARESLERAISTAEGRSGASRRRTKRR